MSLINEQQKKNSEVRAPVVKPLKSVPTQAPTSPTEGLTPAPIPEELIQQVESPPPQPPSPESAGSFVEQPPQTSSSPSQDLPNIDLFPIAPVEVEQPPEPTILPTVPIWKDTSQEFGSGAALKPEVASTMLPSFSVQIPDNSAAINRSFASLNTSASAFNSQAREEYAAAQRAQEKIQQRGALPNTPDATKRWSSAPLGFLSDVLFGSEKGKKQSEAGIVDPSNASFGRAGAGLGGEINYALGLIPNLFVGAVGEVTKATANGLQALGVKKETAEGFARDGFLTFLPDNPNATGISSLLNKNFRPSSVLNFNFEEANKRNLLIDAIAGDPLNDVNEPDGSVKYGRIYTRSQRKEGSEATSDPVGFALQLGTYIFNPGEIPGDKLVSAGVGKLFSVFKKPVAKAVEEAVKVPDVGFNPSVAIEQPNLLSSTYPRLNTSAPGGAIEFSAPGAELNPPRLYVGEATLEYAPNLSKPLGAQPQIVPRAYLGAGEITRAPLPPVFDPADIPEASLPSILPYSSPAKTALEVGLGNPTLRLEKAGALALRPLAQVLEEIKQVSPKLLEGFDGITWEDFKLHMSNRLPDIGEVSAIGEDLKQSRALTPKPIDYPELAAIVQELAIQKKYTQAQMLGNIQQLNSEALQKYNSGFRVDLTESTIVKQSTDNEVLNTLDLSVLKKNIENKGLRLRGNESPSELAVIAEEAFKIKNTPRFKEILQKQIDESSIAIYDNANDIPKLSEKEFLSRIDKPLDIQQQIPNSFVNTTDDLLTASEELARHKQASELPLQKLDELFEDTVDFGRKQTDSVGFDIIEPTSALKTTEQGGIIKLVPEIFQDTSKLGRTLKGAWLAGDYETVVNESRKLGISFKDALNSVVERNNQYITAANKVRNLAPPPEALTKVDTPLYHGTILDNWQPPDNLFVNGSRGELGGGTYFTTSPTTANDYAIARVSDNVNPKTFDTDINPTVAQVTSKFTNTLDARKPLPKETLKQVFSDLPPEVLKKFSATVNKKKKPLDYVSLRGIMEESFVKAGVEPTEEIMQQVDANVGKNLRALGFDSVLDKESGFLLSLDNSRVEVVSLSNVQKPSLMQSTVARLNADAEAAKHYSNLLSSDANLRDSAYKYHSQVAEGIDKKLAQVQDEIISRGIPKRDTLLPKLETKDSRPTSFVDTLDDLNESGVCDL